MGSRHGWGNEEDSLAKYIGGVTEFGRFALKEVVLQHRAFGSNLYARLTTAAIDQGLIVFVDGNPELTHVCKEVSDGTEQACFARVTKALPKTNAPTRRLIT